jgi:hypothetical protein
MSVVELKATTEILDRKGAVQNDDSWEWTERDKGGG